MIQYRPHQQRGEADIRAAFASGKRSVLYVAPTGSGKTVLFAGIAHGAMAKGKRVAIMAHRGELLDQISETLKRFDTPHSFIAAGYRYDPREPIQVASSPTLVHRCEDIPAPDLIISDEAHHGTTRNTIGKIMARWHISRRLGVTATPTRLSGEGLGDLYDCMILGPTVEELTDAGLLSPARIYAPPGADLTNLHIRAGDFVQAESEAAMDKPSITGDAVSHWRKHADGLPFVAFACSIKHAEHVAAQFRANGVDTLCIHGQLDRQLRNKMVAEYRAGVIRGLVSVDIISEGFDLPGISCGIFLRPTASRGLWIQQFGRILRTHPEKTHAIALDHAGNTARHGDPTEAQEWTLEGRTKGAKQAKQEVNIRICPACYAAYRSQALTCPQCGHRPEVKARKVEEVEGELVEWQRKVQARDEVYSARTLEELVAIGRRRGYANPGYWSLRIMNARKQKKAQAPESAQGWLDMMAGER